MICKSCRKEIPDGYKFCTYCGAMTESVEVAPEKPSEGQITEAQITEEQIAEEQIAVEQFCEKPTSEEHYEVKEPEKQPVKKKSGKALTIVMISLAAAFAISTAVFVYLYISSNIESSVRIEALESDLQISQTRAYEAEYNYGVLESEYTAFSDQYYDLYEENQNLQAENDSLYEQVNDLYSLNGNLGTDSYYFDMIKTFESGNTYDDFMVNKDVVILDKGDSKVIYCLLNHEASSVTVNWTDGSVASHQFGDWDGYQLPFTITAKSEGVSYYTFTNSYNSESFKVMVIVR